MGAKNKPKTRGVRANAVEVVGGELFSAFKGGPGKPSLNQAYLLARRDALIWEIEPHWHEIGRALETARGPEDIRKAFEIAAGGTTAESLAPVLRGSSEPATSAMIEQTREKLGEVNARLYKINEDHQRALQAYRDSEHALSLVSEPFERDLRRDLTLREENIREIKIQITGVTVKLRAIELQRRNAGESRNRQEEVRRLQSELDKLVIDLAADVTTCIRLHKRLALITSENHQIVSDEASKWKEKLDAVRRTRDELDREHTYFQNKLLDQVAFYFRQEILRFIQQCKPARSTGKQRYGLIPRNLANAIAGLPYITARHSAEMCAELETTIPEMRNYSVFVFVRSVWNRRDERGARAARSLIDWFEREIRKLPKYELVERKPHVEGKQNKKEKVPNQFRIYLAENWYYLKRAIEECEQLKLGPRDAPYAITKSFLARSMQPEMPAEPICAERERITN